MALIVGHVLLAELDLHVELRGLRTIQRRLPAVLASKRMVIIRSVAVSGRRIGALGGAAKAGRLAEQAGRAAPRHRRGRPSPSDTAGRQHATRRLLLRIGNHWTAGWSFISEPRQRDIAAEPDNGGDEEQHDERARMSAIATERFRRRAMIRRRKGRLVHRGAHPKTGAKGASRRIARQ